MDRVGVGVGRVGGGLGGYLSHLGHDGVNDADEHLVRGRARSRARARGDDIL